MKLKNASFSSVVVPVVVFLVLVLAVRFHIYNVKERDVLNYINNGNIAGEFDTSLLKDCRDFKEAVANNDDEKISSLFEKIDPISNTIINNINKKNIKPLYGYNVFGATENYYVITIGEKYYLIRIRCNTFDQDFFIAQIYEDEGLSFRQLVKSYQL